MSHTEGLLAAAPTPPAPNMRNWIQKLIAAVHFADKAIEARGEGSSKDWVLDHFLPALTEHGLGICLLQNAPTPPAQDEPVGCSDGYGTRIAEYRTPADDKLRKAAEGILHDYDNEYGDFGEPFASRFENLRAALEME